MTFDAVLGPDDTLADRPFTDTSWSELDGSIMRRMLAIEREYLAGWAAPAAREPGSRVLRGYDDLGRRRLLVVPDVEALLGARDPTAVGFFGNAREDVDHAILFELEDVLVERMPIHARYGLLSYFDLDLGEGTYGNLILFATAEVPDEWHADVVHRRAVELSPRHYRSIRLHKGAVLGGVLDGDVRLERTKYFDFGTEPPWQGLRRLARSGPEL